ncbi:MAG: PDZ domain-containing protein [Vicinamibacterales bacterium]
MRIQPGGAAARAGLSPGDHVRAVEDDTGHRVEFGDTLPARSSDALDLWRRMYALSPTGPLVLHVDDEAGQPGRRVVVDRPPVWSLDAATIGLWLREYHLGPLAKHLFYTLAALLVIALGACGRAATLLTAAFLLMGVTDAGLLLGAERRVGLLSPCCSASRGWPLPLSFPIIALAVLHVPRRAEWLDHRPWVPTALCVAPAPLAAIGLAASAFLVGRRGRRPGVVGGRTPVGVRPASASASRPTASWPDGVRRYKRNPDAAERRRLETMVITAVPGGGRLHPAHGAAGRRSPRRDAAPLAVARRDVPTCSCCSRRWGWPGR